MYTREFFLMNPEFIRWVKSSDEDLEIYWKNWLEANPESLQALTEARELVRGIKFENKAPSKELENQILSEILKETAYSDKNQIVIKEKSLFDVRILFKVAAVFVFGILLSWYFYPRNEEIPVKSNIAYLEKAAGLGEKLSFALPDGTRVWLNSNSKLAFPSLFDDSTRTVELIGEGYFEVAKDENKPFKVITNNSITTAIGTSFNINSKSKDKLKISLITGIVAIEDMELNIENKILQPTEQILINKTSKNFEIRNFEIESEIAWKEGKLIFENNTFDEVIQKLIEWYGVEFSFENTKNVKWNFSGEYKNQSLELVLKSMSYVEDFEFEIKEKQVKIKF